MSYIPTDYISLGFYGDGSDGAVTLGAGTTTLTKEMNYTTLVVPNGSTLDPGGFRVNAKVSITVATGGIITRAGGDASGATNGSGYADGSTQLGGSASGGSGSFNFGNSGSGIGSNGIGGVAGDGGNSGASTGGTGGSQTPPNASKGTMHCLPAAATGQVVGSGNTAMVRGGTGAGGGAGDAINQGGGGGGGGGVMILCSPTITNNGTITANGGAGANGTAGNAAGGGGGGGGVVVTISKNYFGTAPTVAGGVHVNVVGTGTNGTNCADGLLVQLTN